MSYQDKLRQGEEYQDFICYVLMKEHGLPVGCCSSKKWQLQLGETIVGRVEIKYDSRMMQTGNVSIEIAENVNGKWIPSGILRNDSSFLYCQGCYEKAFMFSKRTLREYLNNEKPKIYEAGNSVRKFHLTMDQAKQLCEFELRLQPPST